MAAKIEPITDDATYKRVQARLLDAWDTPAADPEEEAELRMLAEELQRYAHERFEINRVKTDGVHEIAFMLDQGIATLPDMVAVFGGRDRFIEYMTRRRNVGEDTIDAILANFDTKREWIDKQFCKPPGNQDISAEGQEPCDNPECCTPGHVGWRLELAAAITHMDRQDMAGLGVG